MSFDLTPIQADADQWQHIREAFRLEGVDVPDEAAGEIEQDGIKARFTFDGQTLRVTVTDKPFLYPESVVKRRLENFIESAK